MKTVERYDEWLEDEMLSSEDKAKLKAMNEQEIEDAFYRELEFGTAGIRGIIGLGTNRINSYVIRKVTMAFGTLILQEGPQAKEKGVVIAHDTRHCSDEFALTAALVLCAMGIKVYLFDDIRATPQLSFAVRYLGTQAGIMITASHNPKEYNGYKAYWDDGAQILPEIAEKIEQKAKEIKSFSETMMLDEAEARSKGLLLRPDSEVDDEYFKNVKKLALNEDIDKDISIVYTPLNGTGLVPVERILRERGFSSVHIVEEQRDPDPDFTTAPFPNPEDERAFEYAIKLGKEKKASILIANDPDCDRTAIMVFDGERYRAMNGNQTGALLIRYMMDALKEKDSLPEKGMIIKSIVTGDLGKAIAKQYGVVTFDALTGFKNICNLAIDKEKQGYKFLFGYEESIGYTAGTFVRDKDGVISTMLICEAAAYYSRLSLSLYDVLGSIYSEYGYYKENNFSIKYEGQEGSEKIDRIMKKLRARGIKTIGGMTATAVTDYLVQQRKDIVSGRIENIDIPSSNVLKFEFGADLWLSVRPSGTEPKIKIYIYCKDTADEKAELRSEKTGSKMKELIEKLSNG